MVCILIIDLMLNIAGNCYGEKIVGQFSVA